MDQSSTNTITSVNNNVGIKKPAFECLTVRVDDLVIILGIGRSAAYTLVRDAEATGKPFIVLRIGNSILISKRSLNEYLESMGLGRVS